MATMSELKATTTARERVEAAVAKAQASQPRLNAVVTFVEVEDQLAALNTIPDGPFHGMPVVLKDNVCTRGVRTTASSKILDNYVPVYNAHIVDKLKAAGAVVIAKASMDELAMGGTNLTAATGPVYNPYDRTRMAGGSSGGSAALVAAGVVPFAVGSDTGDSVRKPASFCGVLDDFGKNSAVKNPYIGSLAEQLIKGVNNIVIFLCVTISRVISFSRSIIRT